ncbi:MAG: hypothetical protein JWP00_3576 [Chloroflexi bacterium]|nr:hypothetical protein [Chloroflexota bacterium]
MTPTAEYRQFERLVQRFEPGSHLKRAWELKGGVSARVTALEVVGADGRTKKMVVRQHGPADLAQNPQIAEYEFKLLQILQSAGIPAPVPYYLDQSGQISPDPYLIMEYIEGELLFKPVNLDSLLRQIAAQLAQIHRLDCSKPDLAFLTDHAARLAANLGSRPARLDDSLDEGRLRDILEAAWPFPHPNKPGLLHGDFWPGNILCKDNRLAAVIDWEDAGSGDPLADLANTRLEIMWAFGIEALERFTGYYRASNPLDFTALPFWDLCAALRPALKLAGWAADSLAEERMREGHRLFTGQAFERLDGY